MFIMFICLSEQTVLRHGVMFTAMTSFSAVHTDILNLIKLGVSESRQQYWTSDTRIYSSVQYENLFACYCYSDAITNVLMMSLRFNIIT